MPHGTLAKSDGRWLRESPVRSTVPDAACACQLAKGRIAADALRIFFRVLSGSCICASLPELCAFPAIAHCSQGANGQNNKLRTNLSGAGSRQSCDVLFQVLAEHLPKFREQRGMDATLFDDTRKRGVP
jgi:hypothetical protein